MQAYLEASGSDLHWISSMTAGRSDLPSLAVNIANEKHHALLSLEGLDGCEEAIPQVKVLVQDHQKFEAPSQWLCFLMAL